MKLLVVDDSKLIVWIVTRCATPCGMELVGTAHNGETALRLAFSLRPDLITLDREMPDMDGLDVLDQVMRHNPQTRVIMLSADGSLSAMREAFRRGAVRYLVKPCKPEDIESTLREVGGQSVASKPAQASGGVS